MVLSALFIYLSVVCHSLSWLSFLIPLSFPLLLLSVGVLIYVFIHSEYVEWIWIVLIFLPFERSCPVPPLPSLSPLDYFSFAAASALLWREKPATLMRFCLKLYQGAFWIWAVFFIFGCIDAGLTQGNPRGVFRIAIFHLWFVIAFLAVEKDVSQYRTRLSTTLSYLGGFIALVALYQFMKSHGNYQETYGTFFQHNAFGAYLSLCLPAAFAFWNAESSLSPKYNGLPFLLMAAAFILCRSRGAWLGMAGGLSLVLLLKAGVSRVSRILLIVIPLVSLGLTLTLTPSRYNPLHMNGRHSYWPVGQKIFQAHPLRGLGPGNYERDVTSYMDSWQKYIFQYDLDTHHRLVFWQHLHNAYLQLLVEYGLIGFLLWFGGMMWLVNAAARHTGENKGLWPYCFLVSIAAFFIHNTVDVLFVASFDLIVAFLLAATMFRKPQDQALL